MSVEGRDPRDRPGEPAGRRTEVERPPQAGERDDRSVVQLIRDLGEEGAELVRQEIALAKVEMQEKVDTYQKATVTMAVGGGLLFAALLVLLWALNIGLTALFSQWMGVDVAVWLAPLVLALALGIMGYSFLKGGQSSIREEGLTPEKTKRSLEKDRSWARTRARRLKEEVRHE